MPSVSVIIPTRNEEANISNLLSQILPYGYEVLVVDDSDDNTRNIALDLGARVLIGQRKGLGQAIVDGINSVETDIVVVCDADLSHNPKSIPNLVKPILEQGYDMTIGSRYVKGGSTVGWTAKRKIISYVASSIAFAQSST